MARKPVQGARPWTSLAVYVGHKPPYCPSWLWHDAPRERGENTSKPGRQPWVPGSLYAKRGTLPSTLHSPAFLRRPRPSLSLMRPSWSYGDGGSHPFSPRSGERRGLATLTGVDSNCATLWQASRLVQWGVPQLLHPPKEWPHVKAALGATQGRLLP